MTWRLGKGRPGPEPRSWQEPRGTDEHRVGTLGGGLESTVENRGQLPARPLPGCSSQSQSSGNGPGCVFYCPLGLQDFFLNLEKKSTSIRALKSFLKPAGFRGSRKAFFATPRSEKRLWFPQAKAPRNVLPRGSVMWGTSRKWLSQRRCRGREVESSGERAGGETDRWRQVLHSTLFQPGFAFCLRGPEVPMTALSEEEKTCSG